MHIELLGGVPAIVDSCGNPVLTDISCGVRYPGKFYNTLEMLADPGWTLTATDDHWIASTKNARIRFQSENCGMTIVTEFTNAYPDIDSVTDFIVLRGYLPNSIRKLLGSGLNNVNGNRTNEMQTPVETLQFLPGQSFECADFAACIAEDDRQWIAGFLTYLQFFGSVFVMQDGTIEVRQFPENHPLPNRKSFTSDVFYITPCDNLLTALPAYCEKTAAYMGGALHRFDVPSGYCTWYYYLFNITEKIADNAVTDISSNREKLPVQYVQVDDGWQRNNTFPSGMKACADNIKKAGYKPGLWFAPFFEDTTPTLLQDHPEMFAKDRHTGERVRCLDFSVPATCEHIYQLFHTATYDWGFEYLKLDAITTALGAYQYSDPDFNSVHNYRKCLQVIQSAVPENTFILGCTAPFGSAIGLVDGMRVSCDIFENWNAVCNVFNSVLKRYYYHKHYFINDADCLIVRKAENEDDECYRRCTRNDEEIRTYISVTAASGGIIMLSDKLRLLSDAQIQQLSYLFPVNTEAAIPLDLMDSRIPGILDCGTRGRTRVAMLINWDNVPKTMVLPVGNVHAFEFWGRQYLGRFCGKYEAVIPAHGCQVLVLSEGTDPAVIGTDSVLIPRFSQNYVDGILTFSFHKKGETYYIAANELYADGVQITQLENGLYAVTQSGEKLDLSLHAK